MKYLKILGLAAVAAMAMMAFAGSASATELYKTESGKAVTLGAGTVLSSSLTGSSILKSGGTTLNTCTGGKFTTEITSPGSSTTTTTGKNTTIDFEGCVSTVHTESTCPTLCGPVKNGTLEVHHIAGTTNGTLTASGVVIGNTIFGTNCLYESGTGKDLGTLTGNAAGNASIGINITVNEAEPKKAICPDTATWEATFKVTTPSTLYVEAS
jgi:hypothetical protein